MAKFVCGFCGKEYDSLEDRMGCEQRCFSEQIKKKKEEEKQTFNARKEKAYKDLCELTKQRDIAQEALDNAERKYFTEFGNSSSIFEPYFYWCR